MMSTSFQFNDISWEVKRFGATAWLVEPRNCKEILKNIHQLTNYLEQSSSNVIIDIIPAYNSIAIFLDKSSLSLIDVISDIQKKEVFNISESPNTHIVKVCYELGLDWNVVTTHIGISKEAVIELHLQQKYEIAMMGFLPGFVFLEGMDARILVPRKENPRIAIPTGAVGIGGTQTGFYSLESPGGWQIIGRTPDKYFDVHNNPPTYLQAGDAIVFERISEDEFHLLEK